MVVRVRRRACAPRDATTTRRAASDAASDGARDGVRDRCARRRRSRCARARAARGAATRSARASATPTGARDARRRGALQRANSLFGVGAPEALVIGVVSLLVFGPKGLADIAKQLGATLREFQPTIRELQDVSREFQDTLRDEIEKPLEDAVSPATPSKRAKAAGDGALAREERERGVRHARGARDGGGRGGGRRRTVTEEMKAAAAAAAWGASAAEDASANVEAPVDATIDQAGMMDAAAADVVDVDVD